MAVVAPAGRFGWRVRFAPSPVVRYHYRVLLRFLRSEEGREVPRDVRGGMAEVAIAMAELLIRRHRRAPDGWPVDEPWLRVMAAQRARSRSRGSRHGNGDERDDGLGGVREPRRPQPNPPSIGAERDASDDM